MNQQLLLLLRKQKGPDSIFKLFKFLTRPSPPTVRVLRESSESIRALSREGTGKEINATEANMADELVGEYSVLLHHE